jgi:hypothetical protein
MDNVVRWQRCVDEDVDEEHVGVDLGDIAMLEQ